MVVTTGGIIIRFPVGGVRVMGRATQGVKLINLEEGHRVGDVARVVLDHEAESAASSQDPAVEQLPLRPEEE
ncbi:MAG: DNA gyrase C-terminal beta-propeller domain-containing protein, partial [Gemmatimonadota bacterium]